MYRAVFTKTGNAVWISHLDLMRVLQRAFRRGGLLLKHSQGFNPHPCLSLAFALSVGVSGTCELMDFELAEETSLSCEQLKDILNRTLPEGIVILDCYTDGRRLRDVKWLDAALTLEYDTGAPADAAERISALFEQRELTVLKHSKKGDVPVDLIPSIREVSVSRPDGNSVEIRAVVSAQEPVLNPMLLETAVETHCPDLTPDFCRCVRNGLYDAEMNPFR